ncbi:MAG TPA: hypothetical protein VHP36_07530 [Chitinispirillaceae bacterium]|nr:hypothetical protein [Chitinispirillaceae bacterium]
MDIFTEDDLRDLISVHFDHCVSIFIPTFRTGSDLQQNPIRFKNLISTTMEKLILQGYRSTDAETLLAPLKRLLQNGSFWQHLSEGLAAFLAPGTTKIFRLPAPFLESLTVGPSFHLKPLLSLLSGNTRFYLLDLEIKNVRLFEGSRLALARFESEKIPLSLDDALHFDVMEKNTQFSSKPSWNDSRHTTIFGYGRQTDKQKINIMNFYHKVSDAIEEILQSSNDPLILGGVDYLHSLYREANKYPYLTDNDLTLDLKNLSESEIHQRVWPIIQPHFQKKQLLDTDTFRQYWGQKSRLAATDLKTIVSGAIHGRIQTLFVSDTPEDFWGKYLESRQDVEIHANKLPDDEDLLDKAAINTILRKGTVYVVNQNEMPVSGPIAAILRY